MGEGRRCGDQGEGRGRRTRCCTEKRFLVAGDLLLLWEVTQKFISAGARPQPRVHFQRRALRLPENTSYSDLTAFLTAASSPSEVDSFPYLRGLDGNGTGNWSLFSSQLGFLCLNFCMWLEALGLTGRTRIVKLERVGNGVRGSCLHHGGNTCEYVPLLQPSCLTSLRSSPLVD